MKRFKSGSNLVFCTLGLAVVTAFLAGPAAAARPGGERPLKEPDDPQRVVGVLHDQVEWWAREPQLVALAGEFVIDVETLESPEPGVDWRLVLTTLDREVVTSWSGYTPFRDGRGVAFVNFDGRDADGHPLPAGTYVYRFEAEGYDGSGGFLKVWASDAVPEPQVPDEAGHVFTPLSPSIPWNFYFGSHHNHSTYSDGGIPVATCNGAVESAHAGADPGGGLHLREEHGRARLPLAPRPQPHLRHRVRYGLHDGADPGALPGGPDRRGERLGLDLRRDLRAGVGRHQRGRPRRPLRVHEALRLGRLLRRHHGEVQLPESLEHDRERRLPGVERVDGRLLSPAVLRLRLLRAERERPGER